MTDLFIPPWLRISASRPGFASNSAAAESVFTGAARTTERSGDKVKVSFRLDNANRDEASPHQGILKAIRGALRGHANRVWYTPTGYTPRGSFPATELLSNNTFADGTTNWSVSSATLSISSSDRVLRSTRLSNPGSSSTLRAAGATTVQYAPYVARGFAAAGRGPMDWRIRLGTTAGGTDIATHAADLTTQGMASVTGVALTTSTHLNFLEGVDGPRIAGDYMDFLYASLARCALIDNGPNLLLQSDEFDTSWTTDFASVNDQATTHYEATSTADALIEDNTTNVHRVDQAFTVASTTNLDYCLGVALKADTRTWARISLIESTGTTAIHQFFNLSTGVAGAGSTGGNWSDRRSHVESLGDGWYACYVIGRKTSSATSITARIALASADNTASYAGDNTSQIFVARAAAAQAGFPMRLRSTTSTASSTGVSQTGSGLYLRGMPASTNGLLLFGDWVQIGNQLCMVAAPLDSDAAGKGFLQLTYPPRSTPSDGAAVIIHEPFGRFYSMDIEGGWEERPGVFTDHEFSICEALDE